VVASLGLYGMCISCFLVAGQVFANKRAARDIRASAQGLLTFLNGLGLLVGNVLVGWVREQVEGDFPLTFAAAGAVMAPLLVVFLVGFYPSGAVVAEERVPAEGVA
jgi:MFS family permease